MLNISIAEDEYYKNQTDILEKIKESIKNELSDIIGKIEMFQKGKDVKEDWRYGWLRWLNIYFNEELKEKMKPYAGIQLYLYHIEVNDIGNITLKNTDVDSKSNNLFPFDHNDYKYFQMSDDMDIDLKTGNIIKKDKSCSGVQLWLFQEGSDHKGVQENGLNDNNIKEFFTLYKQKGIKDYSFIRKYYESLINEKLVSSLPIKSNDYFTINNCIRLMVEHRIG